MLRHVSIIRSSTGSCPFLAKITLLNPFTASYSYNNLAIWQHAATSPNYYKNMKRCKDKDDCDRVFVVFLIRHEMRMRSIIFLPVACLPLPYLYISVNSHVFSKKKKERKKERK